MIPEKPRSFSKESLEDIMFEALEKLPNDYYVFHSFKVVNVIDGQIKESEADFVIFNRTKGILCLEAKAGHVKYDNGVWRYASGKEMSHDGPYNQAAKNKWVIKDCILNSSHSELLNKCKLLHAVWFPSVSLNELQSKILAPEADIQITLTKDDLLDPQIAIDRIFNKNVANSVKTTLSEKDREILLKKVLCPSFDLVPAISFEADLNKQIFHRMLREQTCVLNFLVEQRTAVIQGAAGTGKTLVALEKARRHANNNERVLFLCYNKYLQEYISENNPHENIDYYTIDGYACKLSDSALPDYKKVKEILEGYYLSESFPYQHVIIDEGQDFGQDDIEENNIISLLFSIIEDNENNGSFYIFYDSMQLVQGRKVPDFITNADCKLTLYKNCRNTENIAKTSMKPLRSVSPKLIDGCVLGTIPKMHYCDEQEAVENIIDNIIATKKASGIDDIVILTCQTEQTSVLSNSVSNGRYKNRYKFTTCRKFKGLEADAVILADLSKRALINDAAKVFYVGASRARLELDIVTNLHDQDCLEILEAFKVKNNKRNPQKKLATEMNTLYQKYNM